MIASNDEEAIFPEDWYKNSAKPETGLTVSIQCFDRPDYSKLPTLRSGFLSAFA